MGDSTATQTVIKPAPRLEWLLRSKTAFSAFSASTMKKGRLTDLTAAGGGTGKGFKGREWAW